MTLLRNRSQGLFYQWQFTSNRATKCLCWTTPGGVLGISSDGDDRRIFLGLKFSILGFFLGRKIWQYFFGVAWFFVGTFGGIKKNRYCPGGCIALRIKYRQTNVFCFCLIVNYGVALHRTCYTIVCIVPWYPAVYKTSTTSIQSVGFTVTEIPLNCFSELLISFTFELLRATKSAWYFLGVNFRHFWSRDFLGFCWKP